LKIEYCKLNICGCRSRSAGAPAAPALARRVRRVSLRHFKNGKNSLNIQYSIDNIQSLQDSKNIPIQFFCHKMHKNNN